MDIKLPTTVAIAPVCGATPLIAGAAIFIAWCSSGASWLEGAGLLNILVGIVLFGVGALSLILYLGRAIAGGFGGDKVTWVWVLTAAALLVLNFPVCGAIMDSVGRIQANRGAQQRLNLPTVHVVNLGSGPANDVKVLDGGAFALGPLAAGEATSVTLEPESPGTPTCQATIDGKLIESVVPLTTSDGRASNAVVVILPDGSMRAETLRRSGWGRD